jgi:hypothetical protein
MGGVLDPRLTFSRASTATFVNSSGYVDHAGANLLLYSAYADTNWIGYGTYTKSYTTGVTSPIGNATAARITFDAVGKGLYYNSASLGSPNVVGATYTMSAWIRATASTTNANIRFGDSGVGIEGNIPITTTWTRYSLTYTNAVSSSSPAIQSASGTPTGEFEMWGFQLNPGSTAQTYYPTTTAAYHAPRFDYSPTNIGEPRGLLVEGQGVNLALNSSTLSSSTYTAQEVTSGTGSANDPSNAANAPKLTPSVTNAPHLIYSTVGVANATSYTLSVFAKANGYNRIGVCIAAGARYTAVFNLTGNGSFQEASGTASPVPTGTSYAITKIGTDGWYRCSVTMTSADTTLYPHFMVVNDGAITFNVYAQAIFAGDTSKSIYVWGAQLEAGSGASSYIPTGASQVTRTADSCVMTGTNFSSWYTQGIGTVCWSGSAFRITAGHLANINTVNNDPRITAYVGAGALTNLVTNGTTQVSMYFGSVTANTAFKAAWRFNTNDFAACLNAGTVYTDTAGTVPTGVDRMQLGAAEGGYQFLDGWIKSIKYYPTALPDAQLQALTAP